MTAGAFSPPERASAVNQSATILIKIKRQFSYSHFWIEMSSDDPGPVPNVPDSHPVHGSYDVDCISSEALKAEGNIDVQNCLETRTTSSFHCGGERQSGFVGSFLVPDTSTLPGLDDSDNEDEGFAGYANSSESSLFKNKDSEDDTDGSSLMLPAMAQIDAAAAECNVKDSDADYSTDTAGPPLMLPPTQEDGDNVKVSDDAKQGRTKTQDDNASLDEFFNRPDIQEKLATLSQSNFIAYAHPTTHFHRIINILNVSRGKKVGDCQGKESNNCEIQSTYRAWIKSGPILPKVIKELEIAMKKLSGQKRIHSFFKTISKSSVKVSADGENNNLTKPKSDTQQKHPPSNFELIGLSNDEVNLLKSSLKIDKELLQCRETFNLLQKFKHNEKEYTEKMKWQHKTSKFGDTMSQISVELQSIKDSLARAVLLCDKERNHSEARDLPLEEMLDFLKKRIDEANSEFKGAFLRLRSTELMDNIRKMNHEMRKRISYVDLTHASTNEDLKITCNKAASTWNECLKSLEDSEWKPTSTSGNVNMTHFYTCRDMFIAAELRGEEAIQSRTLLEWLNITEKKQTALETLVENLPLLMVKAGVETILINVSTFLKSDSLMAQLMTIAKEEKSSADNQDLDTTKEGTVPNITRKPGSGRKRIVEERPEILESIKTFAESAGVSAHNRRQTDIGHFGFTIEQVQNFLKKTVFKDHQDKVPSVSTLRRVFEPPNKAASTSSHYKSDIPARPAPKRNDAPGSGKDHHPHRHECSAAFKMSREFFSLFEDECSVVSSDNKAKIPVGLPCVSRYVSLQQKLFLTDSTPNMPDHDVLRTGSLINPEGYMFLDSPKKSALNETEPDQDADLESRVPNLDITDEICQLDGAGDSSEDEFEINFIENAKAVNQSLPRKRARIESCSDSEDDNENIRSTSAAAVPVRTSPEIVEIEDCPDEENQDCHVREMTPPVLENPVNMSSPPEEHQERSAIDIPPHKILEKDGREHVAYQNTGRSYIFYKSHRAKPSNISRHCNDILTIAETESSLKEKPNLLLLLDDGADYGGRSLQTLYYLGILWMMLNLDMLIIARNSPGDSRWNPIERLWGLITKRIAGLILPRQRPDQTEDEAEDEAIQTLINTALKDVKFDGHPVTNVHVPCCSSKVEINGETFENDFIKQEETETIQKIMEDTKMNKQKLRKTHPEIADKLKIIFKHVDIRSHGFIFRKCSPLESYNCNYCKQFPPRSSLKLWKSLPKKESGGLFFDCELDEKYPGHYRTLLDMMKDVDNLTIKPDSMFPEVLRCKENKCMTSFKSKADSDRHWRLAHKDDIETRNPNANVCNFKVDGVICGQVFETPYKLLQHKRSMNPKHINQRRGREKKT